MNVLSLGAGVQSSTLLLMADSDEIPEKLDAAIFADTGWEPRAVYEHLEWLERTVSIPIVRVSVGNILDDTLAGRLPRADGQNKRFATMPFHLRNLDGEPAMLRRQCTNEYKVRPIRAWIARRQTDLWLGISLDECHRMKPSGVKYIANRYPLIEHRMTRHDCLRWLSARGFPIPPKSACVGCPFHGDAYWRGLRSESPEEWQAAVRFDASIRNAPQRVTGTIYVHRSLQPLDEVDLRTPGDYGQQELFGQECEGICGV